jgi:Fe(3+) dicitrate transport protein
MFSVLVGLLLVPNPVDSTRTDSLQTIEIQANSAFGMGRTAQELGSGIHLNARQLRSFMTLNPNELAALVPGLMARDEDGFGLRMNWGIRGTGTERSSRIVLMEDGVLTAPAPYSAPAAYYQPSLARMAGMDVVKGSSQIAAGPQTTGGAINFQSNPIDLAQRVKFRAALGSFGTGFAHSLVSTGTAKRSASIEWLRQHSDGFRQLDGGGPTGFDFNELVVKGQIRLNSRHVVLAKAIGKTESSNQSYLGLTEEDFAVNPYRQYGLSKLDLMRSQFGQAWVRHLYTGAKSERSTTVYAQNFGRNWYKLDAIEADGGSRIGIASALENPLAAHYALLTLDPEAQGQAEVRANNRTHGAIGVQTHERRTLAHGIVLRSGARLHHDVQDRFQWSDWFEVREGQMTLSSTTNKGAVGNQRMGTTAASAYAEATLARGTWTAVPGIRVESMLGASQKWGAADSLRTGPVAESTAWTTVALPGLRVQRRFRRGLVFASMHRGFASASANPDVDAEQSLNSELGLQIQHKSLNFTATAFATTYQNMLGSDLSASGGGGTGDLFNAGSARVFGIEGASEFRQRIGQASVVHQIQGTWLHSTFTETFKANTDVWRDVAVGDPIPYTPSLQGNLRSEAQLGMWGLVSNLQYVGSSATGLGSSLPQRTLLHGGIFVQPTTKWRIQLDGSNLTGSQAVASMHPSGWRVIGPRMIRLGVSYGW